MPLAIRSIEPGSLADEAGLQAGEIILEINGLAIRDFLELEFYASDYHLSFLLEDTAGIQKAVSIYRENTRPLGITPFEYKHRNCNNHCIFCFIDQMPPKMRKTLYVKDDDYIFSFVFGNYITLTNLKEEDLKRICDQHISPLYVSLHSTNNALRQKMIRSDKPMDAMKILRRLAQCGISFHIQFVCVPGYNDKDELRSSIRDLMDPDLNIESIGVVPVGLTKYREGLCELSTFDSATAVETLDIIADLRAQYDSGIIFAADEFYSLANREVSEDDFYMDYPQLENGIGMLRYTRTNFSKRKRAFLKELRQSDSAYLFACSQSAERWIRQIVKDLAKRLPDRSLVLQAIRNDFFGEHVTVAGLLTAQDIIQQINPKPNSTIVLPSCIFNHEGYTLDGKTIADLQRALGSKILVVDPLWDNWQRYN
ncbi:MAG: DUF512 domain-containing protein [Candidatus Cloacimonetes bacterium]|jgi:putative radical SAM enzyme (TIGR03279 family)|nr:DUF512 domain-containing protein [Candidatus Cloacimonadota bacterium]MDD2506376.1 DUF512 domain-containing protein [Candidatus Cloacimonadota bacterium]MDD4147754.1 DUF512 domain-containing protein [Candidatus Cloacimonadota bacterium]MDD4560056.1 DUF512 domain-containing protein [Candidatus Cloacimonadota bacterium]